MTPQLAVGDVLGGVRREIERNAFRARNGIKHVAGGEWAPVGPTPSDVVWQQGKAQLRRYRREDPARLGPPVLAFLGLVSRAYVFDLWKGNSFVERLMEAGFDTYVLDWGEPDEADAANTLETYVSGYLPRAIGALLEDAGTDDINVIGYCMGGDLALMALAAQPDLPVRNLVTMAMPVDFRHMGPLAAAVSDGRIKLESVLDDTGNVPADVIENFFKIRKPTADLVQYANLWQNLWNDDYMQGYQAMGRWVREHVPMPGAAARQVVDHWLRENAFFNDALRVGGRRVSLGDIRMPTLAVIATRDDVVREPAATPVVDLLRGTRVETLRLDAGHASLTSGRTAAKVTVPRIIDWLADHSEELMSTEVREMRAEDAEALRQFFADVPVDDRTFFKEDIADAAEVARRWIADERSVRRLAFDEDCSVLAFATLSPGVERTSHVADLRLVVAARARGKGLGRTLARGMLLEAVQHGFKKVTIDIAADSEGAIQMFRELGFQPEALLRDHLCDPNGELHDIVVLAHAVEEQWSGMLTAGIDEAVG